MTKPDACRFCRLYAAGVVGFSVTLGAFMTAQLLFGLRKFGGYEYVSRVLVLSSVRANGPAVSGSALLLALVLWAHPLSWPEVQADLRRILTRGLLVSLPGYAVAVVVVLLAGFAMASGIVGQSWSVFRVGFKVVGWRDFGFGALTTLADAALIVFLAWRYSARLQAARLSLPAKLVVVVTVTMGLRATVGLVVSSLLSG